MKTEKERKFVLRGWHPSLLPADTLSAEIVQTYLISSEKDEERRVRVRIHNGASSYYYTSKVDTEVVGVRDEREVEISQTEYDRLLSEQDAGTVPVIKTRHTFKYAGHVFEIDEYREPVSNLVIMEVEVEEMDEPIEFPRDYDDKVEVTGQKEYNNRSIAEGLLGDIIKRPT